MSTFFELIKKYLEPKVALPFGFFLVIFGLILVIVLPNLSTIEEKLGFRTKSVIQQELTISQENVRQLTDGIQTATKDAANQIALGNAKVNALDKLNKDTENNNKVKDKVKQEKNKKISDINNSKLTPEEKDSKIAEVQIGAVWDIYCKFNGDDISCQVELPKP